MCRSLRAVSLHFTKYSFSLSRVSRVLNVTLRVTPSRGTISRLSGGRLSANHQHVELPVCQAEIPCYVFQWLCWWLPAGLLCLTIISPQTPVYLTLQPNLSYYMQFYKEDWFRITWFSLLCQSSTIPKILNFWNSISLHLGVYLLSWSKRKNYFRALDGICFDSLLLDEVRIKLV
jgi:hypothetical protein